MQEKVGERLAKLVACLTGPDVKRVRQLPNLDGLKTEVIIQKIHRNGYDHAVRSAGVKIVEVETREQPPLNR